MRKPAESAGVPSSYIVKHFRAPGLATTGVGAFLYEADSSRRIFLARSQVAEEVGWLKRNLPGPAAAADGTPGSPDQASAHAVFGNLVS